MNGKNGRGGDARCKRIVHAFALEELTFIVP